jgi:hypothetical protein
LRRLINEVEIPQVGRIAASLGVATFPQHADEADLLLKRADEALYLAKQNGRNQVKVSTAVAGVPKSMKESRTNMPAHLPDAPAETSSTPSQSAESKSSLPSH